MNKQIITLGMVGVVAFGASGVVVTDQQINPYEDKSTHYELSIVSDIPQGERVEISKYKAQMDLVGWNDEYRISIKPQIPTAPTFGATEKVVRDFEVSADRPLLSKKMKYKSGDVTAFIEPKEGSENEFDIDFILDSKPGTNVFTYVIEGAEEFDFFYQPALTQEEIDNGVFRPENVVGSYAVYSKTKKDNCINCGTPNYATGKIAHIYRPKVTDANGDWTWAILDYSKGILSVTVPQTFLDTAVYPVVVDPTFGYLAEGGSKATLIESFGITADYQYFYRDGQKFQSPSAGNLTSVVAYWNKVGAADENIDIKAVVNTFDGGGSGIHPQIAYTSSTTINSDISKKYTFVANNESIAASTNYLITFVPNIPGLAVDAYAGYQISYDRRSAVDASDALYSGTPYSGTDYTSPVDPMVGSSYSDTAYYSVYAVYTSSSSGTFVDSFGAGVHSWVAPTNVTSAKVACWGGGGGGFDDTTGTNGGAGGGGGAFASSTVALTPGNTYTVFVASTSPENLPAVGKFSRFVADDKTVLACGGTGATSATTNGVGGTTACSTGDVEFAGGDGGDAVTTDDTGGGGGGAGSYTGTGGAGANGTATVGGGGGGAGGGAASGNNGGTSPVLGHGGKGVTTTYSSLVSVGSTTPLGGGGGGGGDNGTQGGNGGYPGGGGGGAEGNGGIGASGQCTITYIINIQTILQDIIWFNED